MIAPLAERIIIVTGTRGNLGGKRTTALTHKYPLRCLDVQGGKDVIAADLSGYEESWARHFEGADTVLHFAGEPLPTATWARVHRGNIVATGNILRAARQHGVRRVIFASTNQIMAGYRFTEELVTTALPPAPLNPYAVSKLICEEAGAGVRGRDRHLLHRVAHRQYSPRARIFPMPVWESGSGASRCGFRTGTSWTPSRRRSRCPTCPSRSSISYPTIPGTAPDLSQTRQVLGYRPKDGFTAIATPAVAAEEAAARLARLVPGQWLDQSFQPLRG